MATTITAGNATNGAAISSDSTGILELKSGTGSGTTAVTIGTNQAVTFAAGTTINGITVGRGGGSVATNTAVGAGALAANTTGETNTASGYQALNSNLGGSSNTAYGVQAMRYNTSGVNNVALGRGSVYANTTGSYNVGVGQDALTSNTTASYNTAMGYQAGYSLTTNGYNAFFGSSTGRLYTGLYNTCLGSVAGSAASNSNNSNTLVGYAAGYNTTGAANTFVGAASTAGTGCGEAMTTGSKNTILGAYSGNQGGLDIRTASNYIVLSDGDGNPRLYYHGTDATWKSQPIYNFTSANTANMYIGSGYDIGRVTSALKYKQDIRDLENIDIGLFRAVRYKSKCANDDQTKDYFGVIADEVADAGIEELVIRNADGEVESFAYDRLTVVLLKELQRLKAEVAALKGQS